MKVLSVFGTRPEAIKMAPVVKMLEAHSSVTSRVCVTAQHREMLDDVLSIFDIRPDFDLDIMRANQRLSYVTNRVLLGVEELLESEAPDWLLVQGDTTTAMAAAMAAFYQGVPIGHIEAGLRTRDKRDPFPEEVNRRIADILADLHFAPSQEAKNNLTREGLPDFNVLVTGNTIVDALLHIITKIDSHASPFPEVDQQPDGRLILVTAHRRENLGEPLTQICSAIRELSEKHRQALQVVWPVHRNPNVEKQVHSSLRTVPGITLTDPLDYVSFVRLMRRSYLILTDSGGVQEEATVLGKPVLVMRKRTERTEAVEVGTARLVGTDRQAIVDAVDRLMTDSSLYEQMSRKSHVYGDGHASEYIVQALLERSR
jgi:UDP-N-acetylglucosamine 2-epimerase (non-hydrolysing)